MNKCEFYSKLLQEDFPVKYRQDFAEHDSEHWKKIRELRETLARVEAEHATWMEQYDSVVRYGNELLAKHETAQAQLAEAVGFLEKMVAYYGGTNPPAILRKAKAFLARHARAAEVHGDSHTSAQGAHGK